MQAHDAGLAMGLDGPPPKSAPAPDPIGHSVPEGIMYETVVTALRTEQLIFDSSRAITAITRDEIQERGSRTAPEALAEEAGVYVQETNYGGGAPIVRGQFGNRVLVLVDGVRLNNSTYRSGPNQYLNTIDPSQIDRIEVLRGPGSALYGSDAIGGAINVITECGSAHGAGNAYGGAQLRAGSADRSLGITGRVGYSGRTLGLFASGAGRHYGNLTGGDGLAQPFTGYDQFAASACAEWIPRDGDVLTVSLQSTRQYDVPRTDRSTPNDFRMFTLQGRELAYARYRTSGLLGMEQIGVTWSYGMQAETTDRYRVAKDRVDHEHARVGTLGLQLDGFRNWYGVGRFVAGVEAYLDMISTSTEQGVLSSGRREAKPELRRYPEGTGYSSIGAFVHQELAATERLRFDVEGRAGLVFVSLVRDDRLVQLFPDAGLSPLAAHRETVVTYGGGAHARYAVRSWLAASGGLMLGFRAPNVDDFARLGSEGPAYVIPTRNIKPERALSGELSLKAARVGLEAAATYAYTYIDDALARRPTTLAGVAELDGQPLGQVANAESARYHTIELMWRVPLWQRLIVFGNAAWTQAEQKVLVTTDPSVPAAYRTEPGTKIPPPWGRLGIGWHAPQGRWFMEALSRFALEQTRLSSTDLTDTRICPDAAGQCRGTPGWVVFAARAGLRVGGHFRLVLNAEDLTDKRYRYHASGLYAPGRSVVLTAEGRVF
jgi:outer membrane receptor protein involved in Fe transport